MKKGQLIGRGRTAEVFAWGENEVVKLYYPKFPTADIENERRINQVLRNLDLPVARVGEMLELDGRQGFVCEKIDGGSMLLNALHHPWKVRYFARQLADLHAAIHQQHVPDLELINDRLIQHIRWGKLLSEEKKERIIAYLKHLPTGDALCHCDFHPDNILLSPLGPVIIDWTAVVSGNPLADVANTSLILQYCAVPGPVWAQKLGRALARIFHRFYLARYLKLTKLSREAMQAWYVPIAAARLVQGIPAEEKQAFTQLIDNWLAKM